jgi:ATP adenylyltransferase
MDYLRGLGTSDKPPEPSSACFMCDAAASSTDAERRDRLVLWTTDHCVVLLNRYPYTNGHLLIAPRAHTANLEDLTEAEQLDFQRQTAHCVRLLKRAVSPQGFNIGINLGRCAGAGLPGHLHQHVVPRWAGDTNFMSVVGDVRVVPEALPQTWEGLARMRQEMAQG